MTFLRRALIGLYASFFLYIILAMVLGDFGIAEKRRLDNYRTVLNQNLEELEGLNSSLNDKAFSLRKKPDTLRIYARDLDYYEDNEGLIIIEGMDRPNSSYSMGRMLSWNRKTTNRTHLFRVLSLCFGVIIFLILTLFFPEDKHGSTL